MAIDIQDMIPQDIRNVLVGFVVLEAGDSVKQVGTGEAEQAERVFFSKFHSFFLWNSHFYLSEY